MKTNTIELLSELYPAEKFENSHDCLSEQESLFDTLLHLSKKNPFCMLEAFHFCHTRAKPDLTFQQRRYAKLFLSTFTHHSHNQLIKDKSDLLALSELFRFIWQNTVGEDKMLFITYFSELPLIITHELLQHSFEYVLPESASPVIFYHFIAQQIKSYHFSENDKNDINIFATSFEEVMKNRHIIRFDFINALLHEGTRRWNYLDEHFSGTTPVSKIKSALFSEAYNITLKMWHAFPEYYEQFLLENKINPFVFLIKDELSPNFRFFTEYFKQCTRHAKHALLQLDTGNLKNSRLHSLFFDIIKDYQFNGSISELDFHSKALQEKIQVPDFFQQLFLLYEIEHYLKGEPNLVEYSTKKVWKIAEKFQHCEKAALENIGKEIEYALLDYKLKNNSILLPEIKTGNTKMNTKRAKI